MRQEQYTVGFLHWVVSVGSARSAAGARAPIASVVSSVRRNVLPASVELFRFRMSRHIRIKSSASYGNNIARSIGISVNHDETIMRLRIGPNEMKSLSISVRCVTLFKEDGTPVEIAPALSNLGNKSALVILGGLKLNDLASQKSAPGNGRWEFTFATSDIASINFLCAST